MKLNLLYYSLSGIGGSVGKKTSLHDTEPVSILDNFHCSTYIENYSVNSSLLQSEVI